MTKYRSGFDRAGIIECGLERLLRESDVISLHLPLTRETHHLADHDFFLRLVNRCGSSTLRAVR
ncbi:MAG: hypothetical protein IPO12_06235 [Flavobacteriales bacterium]|nr:hypothetical protein [Flavobacteriales bacterium]